MQELAPGMACPAGGDITGVIPALARSRLRSTRRKLVATLGPAATLLAAFGEGEESAWRPETGLSLLALRQGRSDQAALQLALGMAGAGGIGSVACMFDQPEWLYFEGHLIAASGPVQVQGLGDAVSIETEQRSIRFRRRSARWVPDAPLGPWPVLDTEAVAPRYVASSGIRHASEGFPWISTTPDAGVHAAVHPSDVSRAAFIREGWRLIADAAPEYGYWVASTAAGCLLLADGGTHEAQSGSSYDHPGLLAIEPPPSAAYCGELLVHECSHQHLLAYAMVVALVETGSTEISWSPIKRMERTIERVLMGGHAVGNMILYYESLRRSVVLDPPSLERLQLHREWFEQDYAPALEKSRSLTPVGRALWSTLSEAVRASETRTVA